jgi:hypothetical protein
MDRSHYPIRKLRLDEEGTDSYVRSLRPEERIAMVWTLTLQAWMFKEGAAGEPRLRRDVVRTLRSGC